MSALIEITRDIEPLVSSAEAFSLATTQADRARLLAQLRDQLEKLQTLDERARSERTSDEEAVPAAAAFRTGESAAAEKLRLYVLRLQRYLTDTSRLNDPEAHQLLQKAVNFAVGYAAGYQEVRTQLIRFEAGQGIGNVLRARPMDDEVDWAELSREHIARYPKIRARLAE